MKLAVQFFGHLRTFKKCAKSVRKHLLSKYDCDVFIHTWSTLDHRTQTWHCNSIKRNSPIDSFTIKELQRLYAPKKILVEDQINSCIYQSSISCLSSNGNTKMSMQGIMFMLESKFKVNEIRKRYQLENSVEYDYVIMIRPDVKLYKDFNFEFLDREISLCRNLLTRYCAFSYSKARKFPVLGNCASDILYFGTPESIDSVIDVLKSIDLFSVQNSVWNPETLYINELLKHHIASQMINYEYGKDWKIIRDGINISRKDIIQIHIKPDCAKCNFLSFMPFRLLYLNIDLFTFYKVIFCIGKKFDD